MASLRMVKYLAVVVGVMLLAAAATAQPGGRMGPPGRGGPPPGRGLDVPPGRVGPPGREGPPPGREGPPGDGGGRWSNRAPERWGDWDNWWWRRPWGNRYPWGWGGWGPGWGWGSGFGWYDPWAYPGYAVPYYAPPAYGYDGGYGYAGPGYYGDLDSRAAYEMGMHDALSGEPPSYVKGVTPGYKGSYRDAYNAGYYKGLVQRDRQEMRRGGPNGPGGQGGPYGPGGQYQPPRYYRPPAGPPPPPQGDNGGDEQSQPRDNRGQKWY